MAYRDLIEARDYFDVQGLINTEGQRYISRAQIGDDDETGHIYSILVVLAPANAKPPNHMELSFFLVRMNPTTGYIERIQDGRQTKSFLASPQAREGVLKLICSVSCELLKVAKPKVVHYMTADIELPREALKKYNFLCNALKTVGYCGREVDVFHGNHMWVLERMED